MKVKKALALLLALVLTVGLLPGRALAADNDEFTVVNTEQELTDALNEGAEKIKLGKDISSKRNFFISENLVLDLGGYTLSNPGYNGGDGILNIKDGADVTAQNGTASGSIKMSGGELTLKKLKVGGMVSCHRGKLVSMEDCDIAGGNGDNYPQGVFIRRDVEVGAIKNCTINLTGNEQPMPLIVEGGSIDTIEGCTITATSKGTEDIFCAVNISSSGSVGAIKDCTITTNGKTYGVGISIGKNSSVKSIEGCTITANCAINSYGKIDDISGCTLNAGTCILGGEGTIGSVLSNTMTAMETDYGRGIEIVDSSVGTIAYNVHEVSYAFIQLHESGKVKTVMDNAGNAGILNYGKVGTISGNVLWIISNEGTIDLLGNNMIGRDNGIINKGTIKKTDDSSPVDSLDKSKWYYDAMAYAYDENLTFGIPDGKFNPDDKLTRSMLTQMLWNLEERPASKIGTFTDVASGAWYRNSVSWAADKKIVEGYTDGSFKPDNYITREQVATILYRYVKNNGGDVSNKTDLSGYTDASGISAYAREAMQWANAEKLITGTSGAALSPKGNTTCAQMATILMRLVEGPEKPQSLNLKTGAWTTEDCTVGDEENGWRALYLKSVNGNTLTFTLEKVSAAMSFNRIAETRPITVTLENGKGTFSVTDDGWGNSGTGVITVKGNAIHVSVDITTPDPMANWDIAMNADFYPAQPAPSQPDKITVMVSGNPLSLSQDPYQYGGAVMIPMEPVFEAVGIAVFEGDPAGGMTESHAITLMDMGGEYILNVDDLGTDWDRSAQISYSNGCYYVPLDTLDVFGLQTSWDPAKQVITVQGTIAKADRVSAQKIAVLTQFDKDTAVQLVQKAGYTVAPSGLGSGYWGGCKYWIIPVYADGDEGEIQDALIIYDGTNYQMDLLPRGYIPKPL